jgi:hypothetical protein
MKDRRLLSFTFALIATGTLFAFTPLYSTFAFENPEPATSPARVVDLNQAWGVLQDADDVGNPPLPDGYPLRMDPDIGMRLWWAGEGK